MPRSLRVLYFAIVIMATRAPLDVYMNKSNSIPRVRAQNTRGALDFLPLTSRVPAQIRLHEAAPAISQPPHGLGQRPFCTKAPLLCHSEPRLGHPRT